MRRFNFRLVLTTFVLFMLTIVPTFAEDIDKVAQANATKFGLITIIPPLLAIVLAFITKNVVVSLFLGVLSGSLILQLGSGENIFSAIVLSFLDFISRALNALADPWDAGIILQVLAIGGVINLVGKMGGAKAIAEALAKRAKTSKGAQLISWFLGILVFFDDYANSLIVGPIMRPVFDKLNISREKLSFVIDATAAPIAGLAIISTWIGLEVGLIHDAFGSINVDVDAFGVFLQTIPYRFYNILILAFIVLSAIMVREFGPMRKAEYLSYRNKSSKQFLDNGVEELDDMAPKDGVKLSVWNAIIPIGVLILSSLAAFYYSGYSSIMGGEDAALISAINASPFSFNSIKECFSASDASVALFQSAIFATIVAILMAKFKKIYTISEAIEVWVDGTKTLMITGVILILAWSLSSVIKEVGTAKFMINYLSGAIPAFLLPSIIFVLGSIISFSTGTAYGTMGILMPLAIPLAHSINPEMGYVVVSTSAVLTGAIFGDHCSPISDTTILSSMGAGCDHIEHVKTQMPYAIYVASCTILFGYIPAGFGLPVFIVLPMAIFAVGFGLRFIGKRTDVDDPALEAKLKKDGYEF
ncbi:Na+/H+ antiporter NhaC family protein [Peptostreptococcus porci]|uniref:Na+/H+ antiporter NhaC family protein n=1 Tax=Peptostreptococcus porci TaxID=2652282 RepID=UPI002A75B36C|nr:Na+/H+ antiporter NhaC family protein [Peptostreptococcus porci]MDY2794561.1 Na+/H+ antiporter NhaC family protein [Peptostreptococcus porci]MDY4128392.1 Na+/H+ antiporter NhaC family protein [Peptostreptococcus porci]MDY5436426.1 Na+/H+ antiporter NhaC family protein [Peptostreptococcus porci]